MRLLSRYTQVYNEFCTLFEKKIEQIVESCEVKPEDFFNALKRESEKSDDCAFYVEILLAVTEFQNFVDMMKHYKRDHPPQKKE